jgi:hypothetical protein
MPKFTEFFLPSLIYDRKGAAGAVAAGFFVGLLLGFLSGVAAAILLIRDGITPTALLCASITFVMTLVAIGTWTHMAGAADWPTRRRGDRRLAIGTR